MAKGVPPVDEERLPWLEPYRDAIAKRPPPRAKRMTRGAGLVVGGVAAVAAALTAGYYVGQDERTPRPAERISMAEAPVTVAPVAPPVAPPVTIPPPVAASTPVAPVVQEEPSAKPDSSPRATRKNVHTVASNPDRRAARQRAVRNAAIERARSREMRAERQRAAEIVQVRVVRQSIHPWPKMPSPGPAGQVVQLGAFRTEGRALVAYRLRLARYPVLSSMPRVVVPVITKSRGQVLYVLRLGTSSRQQSSIVCRNLRTSGDHCIVIG